MSYIALYRKWRPLVFADVVEQEHVVKTLKNSISSGRIAHAYLFCGTRGTGKTTMAKIFSRAINCLQPHNGDPCNECEICKNILSQSILDVVEIDAASNNSVDNVREIRDEVVYAPSQAKYKVYIIDEVHMLSTGAFNALLKTLEEPPKHVIFILATTEPHKLPATILSRCQRFDFRRITVESIMDRLNKIAVASGVTVHNDALRLIARMSDGAMRDAISILDQCMTMGDKEVSYNDALSVIGLVNDTFIVGIVDAINSSNVNNILVQVEKLIMDGKDISHFVSDLVAYYRNLLVCKVTEKPEEIIDVSQEMMEKLKLQASIINQGEIINIIRELSVLESGFKWANHPRVLLEVSLIKICTRSLPIENGDVAVRLSELEKRINNMVLIPKVEAKSEGSSDNIENNSQKKNETSKPADSLRKKTSDKINKNLDIWDSVINELRKNGRMALYTNLFGSRAIEIDQNFIGIIFEKGKGFNKMLVSKVENAEVVEGIASRLLGREVRIKCLDEDEFLDPHKNSKKDEKDEFVERAQELANRFNVPLNIVDE